MVLDKLKKIRNELQNSAEAYDNAFKNTALIAAQELSDRSLKIDNLQPSVNLASDNILNGKPSLQLTLNKKYFLDKYGSLKNAKAAYQKQYGKQKYGRSWAEFIAAVKQLNTAQTQELSIEARITKIENYLKKLGYES